MKSTSQTISPQITRINADQANAPALDGGENPLDFVVLCIDGVQVPFTGTPFDSAESRAREQRLVDSLNDRSETSWWPEFFKNWKPSFVREYKLAPETTDKDYHPTFSFAISRVCVGYSEHLHAAVSLFAMLGERVKSWNIGKAVSGVETVKVVSASGAVYQEKGKDMPRLISQAVARLLRDQPSNL